MCIHSVKKCCRFFSYAPYTYRRVAGMVFYRVMDFKTETVGGLFSCGSVQVLRLTAVCAKNAIFDFSGIAAKTALVRRSKKIAEIHLVVIQQLNFYCNDINKF